MTTDMDIKKGGTDREVRGQTERQAKESGGSLQQNQGSGITRRNPASLFSLTPRDFFSASPFELMRRFTEDMDRLFEPSSFGWSTSGMKSLWSPPIEIAEKDGQMKICAELPGLNKEDVKVELAQEELTISGERKQEQEDRREGLYRSERSYGSFRRTIPIPEEAEVENAKATFENGILTVSMPVPNNKYHRREIPIESSSGQPQGKSPNEQESAAKTKAA